MNIDFKFIGWCNGENHDKIWGYFLRPTPNAERFPWINKNFGWNCCVFWGRRGKALQFKANETGWYLTKLVDSKIKKGYVSIDEHKLLKIWPTFIEEAEGKLLMAVLAGKVK